MNILNIILPNNKLLSIAYKQDIVNECTNNFILEDDIKYKNWSVLSTIRQYIKPGKYKNSFDDFLELTIQDSNGIQRTKKYHVCCNADGISLKDVSIKNVENFILHNIIFQYDDWHEYDIQQIKNIILTNDVSYYEQKKQILTIINSEKL